MPLYVGLDDTDSLDGGCTTHVALKILQRLSGTALSGYPRLVRLNPNIPWKTRGNGAVALSLTGPGASDHVVGEAGGLSIHCGTDRGNPSLTSVSEVISSVFDEFAHLGAENTHPAFVLSERRPPRAFYERAVRSVVSLYEAKSLASSLGAEFRLYGIGRGLIGALAALAWSPLDRTFEVIAYRQRSLWGSPRRIETASVAALDASFPSTFNSFDPLNHKVAIAPNSPCPVLFGIRGDDPQEVLAARDAVRGESHRDWLLFETNQGTDDHIGRAAVNELHPFTSVRTRGEVASPPRDLPGGHVVFSVDDGTGRVDCTAYEPSKQFRNVARSLLVGDRVEVWGGVRDTPRTVNLERIRVVQLTQHTVKAKNPSCPGCGNRMKSAGADAGYRCRMCHIRVPEGAAVRETMARSLETGSYEPPVCARRHISKPLKRMGLKSLPYPAAGPLEVPTERMA